ncbi:MAG TPA: lysylphosphatidylglycerol synthase transmembrane domain-containing protein [Micavibrio sp.]
MRMPSVNIMVKIAISVGIVALLLTRMDWLTILSKLEEVRIEGMIWGGVFVLGQIALLSWRWADLVNIDQDSPHMTYFTALKITLTSLLANALFITSIGGFVARVGLTLHHGVAFIKTLCAALTDRLMTLTALAMTATLFLPFLDRFISHQILYVAYVGIAGTILFFAIIIPLFYNSHLKDFILTKPKLEACARYIWALMQQRGRFLRILINSLTAQSFYFISVYLIAISSGAHFSFIDLMTVLPVITLVASLPISFGGWGIREGAFVTGLGIIGVPMETAFIISVEIGVLTMVVTILAGVPALMAMNLQKISADLKHLWQRNQPAAP